MKKFKMFLVLVLLMLVACLVLGCGSSSPYVGDWVCRTGFGDSYLTINANGTGSGRGFIFESGITFNWKEQGDHIVLENWSGFQKYNQGLLSPDKKGLEISGPSIYENFEKVDK